MNNTSPLRIVLVGCGGISRAWLDPASKCDELAIAGLVDLDLGRAEAAKAHYALQDAQTGTDVAAMLAVVRPDAVFDCTVPEVHPAVTIAALDAGCHVLGEKPMAVSMSEARRMVEAARRNDRIYAVIQNRRYSDPIIRYRDTIAAGPIGTLTTLNADFYLGPHFGGFREQMPHVLLQDMAIHSFDQARFIAGADARSVYCHEWNPAGSWFSHGASAVAIFEMTNDLVFTYRGSWCAQGLPTSWQCAWRAVGTTGTATWDGEAQIACESVAKQEGFFHGTEPRPSAEVPPLEHGGHGGLIREFVDCIRSGKVPQTVCTDNIKSLAMVEAAVESAERGCKVEITD